MDLFVSHFPGRVDAKGRVSIPATFRNVLKRDGYEGLFVHPSLDLQGLDAGGHALVNEITELLASLTPYSDERDQLSLALLGMSEILKVDAEGRVVLTESLKAHAGIGQEVIFVGVGKKFQIWEPERFRVHLAAAQERIQSLRRELGARSPARAATGSGR